MTNLDEIEMKHRDGPTAKIEKKGENNDKNGKRMRKYPFRKVVISVSRFRPVLVTFFERISRFYTIFCISSIGEPI